MKHQLSKILLSGVILAGVFLPISHVFAANCYTQNLSQNGYDHFAYNNQRSLAVAFVLSSSCTLTDVTFAGSVTGTPTSIPVAFIEANSSGVPSDTILGTSDTITITSNAGATAHFSTPISLTAGTYWFILTSDTTSTSNYWMAGYHTPAGTLHTQISAGQAATWFDEGTNFSDLIVDDNSGGGGGGAATTTPIGGATSTIEQVQENTYHGFVLFLAVMAGVIMFFKKRSS